MNDPILRNQKKRVLFIGDGYPVGENAGSLFYRKFMELYGITNFVYLGIGRLTKLEWPKQFRNMTKKQLTARVFPMNYSYKIFGRLPLVETIAYFILLPLVRLYLARYLQSKKFDLVLCVLRGDVNSFIQTIIQQTKAPLITYISDTVEMEFSDKRYIYNYKVKEHYKAIKNSAAVFVASEKMKDFIEKKFSKPTSILRLGYLNNVKTDRRFDNCLNIFFSGSVYAYEEFELFVRALCKFADKYSDVSVKLIIASNYQIVTKTSNIEIENLGWVDENSLYEKMWQSHIGYIPYKFDTRYRTQSEYAFPSKAGFYLSAGLPIFFHGPSYSSMEAFFEKYECGLHCPSFEVETLVTYLEKVFCDKVKYNQYLEKARIAFENEFSEDIMRGSINKLFNEVK